MLCMWPEFDPKVAQQESKNNLSLFPLVTSFSAEIVLKFIYLRLHKMKNNKTTPMGYIVKGDRNADNVDRNYML